MAVSGVILRSLEEADEVLLERGHPSFPPSQIIW
jgi:hypothetical protein